MRRFLPALIVLAGLLSLPTVADAQSRGSHVEPALSTQERRREWGEMLVLAMIAGGIGTLVLVKGIREFVACMPKRRRYQPDESQF
jgi:hypothetical protein